MNTLLAFWAAQLAALGLVFFAVRHPNGGRKGLLLLLTALPFVLCMLWGAHFKVTPGAIGADPNSLVAKAPLGFALASVPISLWLVLALKGAHWIAATVGLIEIISAFLTAMLATMQVTGSWL